MVNKWLPCATSSIVTLQKCRWSQAELSNLKMDGWLSKNVIYTKGQAPAAHRLGTGHKRKLTLNHVTPFPWRQIQVNDFNIS